MTGEHTQRRLRIGVMGGTFDPIHHGHLVAASEVQQAFDLDEVIFVPTWAQPFKKDRPVSAAEHRYLMTVIATASNPRFTVSRVDIDRGGVTYTIDTLTDLTREYPGAELYFITGADALAQILTWKDSEKLFTMAHMVGVTRPGHVMNTEGMPKDGVSLLEVPAMAISSTDCRERVSRGDAVWYLVPDGVVQYIRKYGLYRQITNPRNITSMTARVADGQNLLEEDDGE
ncbi:nicotinate-nucleotide adenylyltransferase [Actinomyces vulturis]|uniref:nicotinate-nucleotide adenylyltransferase n=1 Tax=Actinomyces vulturis TaxID=1857645 RepID=UPI000A40F44C|nr:nicotinate-nucleotide adenylyltransferase [Actinomyces vulturis]